MLMWATYPKTLSLSLGAILFCQPIAMWLFPSDIPEMWWRPLRSLPFSAGMGLSWEVFVEVHLLEGMDDLGYVPTKPSELS
jgi:hypothetical protein